MKRDYIDGEDTPTWNVYSIYTHIAKNLIPPLDQACLNNDAYAWKKILRMIYRKVKFRLRGKKNINIEEIEKSFEYIEAQLDFSSLTATTREATSMKQNRINNALKELDRLETALMDALYEAGLMPAEGEYRDPGAAVEDFGY